MVDKKATDGEGLKQLFADLLYGDEDNREVKNITIHQSELTAVIGDIAAGLPIFKSFKPKQKIEFPTPKEGQGLSLSIPDNMKKILG